MRNLFLISLLSLFVSKNCHCYGQGQQFVTLKKLTQNDGLSSYNITKIIQDHYGFLWVGTQDGLNCYNGNRFTIFSKEQPVGRKLLGNNVSDIVEDTIRNILWVSTSYGGIDGIDIRSRLTVKHIIAGPDGKAFTGQWVRSLSLAGNVLWIGTYGGLEGFDLEKDQYIRLGWKSYGHVNFDSLNVSKIIVDRRGDVWVCCNNLGIIIIDGKTLAIKNIVPIDQFHFRAFKTEFTFWDIVQGVSEDMYVATSWGARKVLYSSPAGPEISIPFGNRLLDDEVLSCSLDLSDHLWFAKTNCLYKIGLYDSVVTKVADADFTVSNWESSIYQIYSDKRNGIWLGSQEGLGYLFNRASPFVSYFKSSESNDKIQHAYTVLPVGDSIIYCGSQNGLYRINQTKRTVTKIDNNSFCFLLYKNLDNKIIVSNSAGTFVLKGLKLISVGSIYPALKILNKDILNSAILYQDSTIIFGSQVQNGIYVWDFKSGKIDHLNDRTKGTCLSNNVINGLYKGSFGNVWLLNREGVVLFNYINNTCKEYRLKDPHTGKFVNIIHDMCETKESFWFAVYGTGLVETDKEMNVRRIIGEKEGLSNNGVYKVLSYQDKYLLITSNNGLSVLDLGDREMKNYYQSDGLHSNAFEQLCAFEDNNRIYAGGVNGFTVIDPYFFSKNPDTPSVYIDRIKMDAGSGSFDTTNLLLASLFIPEYILQTTVFISALNYRNPGRTKIVYKLKELKTDWIELNGQNFINLIGLGPGKYTLQVRAANEDGVWSDTKDLTLIFLPKWYQTLWFKLLVISAIAGLLYAFFRYRIGQIKKQQQIRKDIASDLHDDIGSTLNTVKIFTHLAQRDKQNEHYLASIEESLGDASMGLRDMIWVLDDSGDTIRELAERIKKFAIPVVTVKDISFECVVGDDDSEEKLSKTQKRNLLLIAKETINNCIKYAECKKIRVFLGRQHNKLVLSIRDDGCGFDAERPAEGNGLKNILQRARQIHFTANISSSPDRGTFIEVTEN